MIAADSSAAVAAFASWHESHRAARRALTDDVRLPAHAALETYSVLTRLPPPLRAPANVVLEFLSKRFPSAYLTLNAKQSRLLLDELRREGIEGGAAYDALIAVTVRSAGASILSCDRRAAAVYERLGVRFEVID